MPKREKHWGIVIDNDDPEKRGRLTVQCDTIAEGDVLEWMNPSFHFVDSSSDEQGGSFWVPNPGAIVEVTIEAEDDSEANDLDPQWKCSVYSQGGVPEVFQENYPKRRGWVTRKGHILYFDDTEDSLTFHYEHPSGAKITVDNDGNIALETSAKVFIGVDDAQHPLTRGDELKDFLDTLKIWLDSHTHGPGTYSVTLPGPTVISVLGVSDSPVSSSTTVPPSSTLNSENNLVE